MAQIEYYDLEPVDKDALNGTIRALIDGVISSLLKVDDGSAEIQFLYVFFGPTETANNLFKISREGGFVYLDNVKLVAEAVGEAAIAKAVSDAITAAVIPVLTAGAAAPIALEVSVGGAAAVAATYLYQAFAAPVVDNIYDIFGVASTKVEITNPNGAIAGGVVYRDGLQNIAPIKAAMDLISWSISNATNKAGVDSHIQLYTNGNAGPGFDVLSTDVLSQIAQDLGVSTADVANRTDGLDASGNASKNVDLLTQYLAPNSVWYNIMQSGSQLGAMIRCTSPTSCRRRSN